MPFIPFNPTQNKKPDGNFTTSFLNNKNEGVKKKKYKTHRRKLNNKRKTQRVRFNLSNNSIKQYFCDELQPTWVTNIEQGNFISDFKVKKVPHITLKELFKD